MDDCLKMGSIMFPRFYVIFVVIFLLNRTADSIIIDVRDIPDSTYLTNISYERGNYIRYIRQTNEQCKIPNDPLHSKYNIIVGQSDTYEPGDYAQDNNVLEIICEDGYKINPFANNFSICKNGNWVPHLATCLRTCPSLTSIESTNVTCKWNDHDGYSIPLRNCINPVEGTTVFLSCNSFYEEPYIKNNPVRVCREGKWDPSIPVCYPICGVKRPKANTNIVNGAKVTPGDYPWQVGVYNSKNGLICGGSILDYRVILSAAHCFTDYDGNVKSNEDYSITAGKYYRDYNDARDQFAQYSKVLKIHVPRRYKGIVNLQGFDIAIIILADPFKISPVVQPVCIELNEESQDLHLSLNKVGTVTGWGYTHSGTDLSDVLKEVEIPYIPYDECYAAVPYTFRRYITHDKICGGYINNDTSVCGGDSGGGLVFKKLNSDQHYIKGIVSVSPSTEEGVCDANQYSVFTSVVQHIDFVRKHLLYNQMRQNIECALDDCLNEDEVKIIMKKYINSSEIHNLNMTKKCTLPNFPPNGKYVLNQNNTYEPGSYVESNSLLSLICDTGFGVTLSNVTQFYCSDAGEWNPSPNTCSREIIPCITPNNEAATCKKLNDCEVIKKALESESIETIRFILKSQCLNSTESLVCCGSSGSPSLIFQHPLLPGPKICGMQAVDDNDMEGTAQVKEFPWLALIIQTENKTANEYYGRGSLISSRYVLTTAYLVTRYQFSLTLSSVILGADEFSQDIRCEGKRSCTPTTVNFGIESFVVHPSYSWNLHYCDIALIKLNGDVEFTDFIRPICLPTSTYNLPDNTDLWVSGWGGLESQTELQLKFKGKVSVLSTTECNLYGIGFNNTFCAARNNSITKRRLCLGDLAGPAIRRVPYVTSKHQWIWVQEGIISFTYIVCNATHYRGLYTKVSEYTDWIVNNIS